ncbi:MAG: redoxin family protein [Rhizobiales bacterium]|nr:redoxin family protein [Hyphomicrobiales bacterium]
MSIAVGQRLPEQKLKVVTGDGVVEKTTGELFAGRKVALFAVPGAFTPTCHQKHLPGFLDKREELAGKGVAEVVCLTVNDPFVTEAWAKASGAHGKIAFVADGNGSFTKALGMDIDLSVAALGVRSKRYAMLVDDGVVKVLNIEEMPSSAERSSAAELLKSL